MSLLLLKKIHIEIHNNATIVLLYSVEFANPYISAYC